MHIVCMHNGTWVFCGEDRNSEGTLDEILPSCSQVWIEATDINDVFLAPLDPGAGPLSKFKRLVRQKDALMTKLQYADVRDRGVFSILSAVLDRSVFAWRSAALHGMPTTDRVIEHIRHAKRLERAIFAGLQYTDDLLTSLVDPDAAYPAWFAELADGLENPLHDEMRKLTPHEKAIVMAHARDLFTSAIAIANTRDKAYVAFLLSIITGLYACCKIVSAQEGAGAMRCLLMGDNHIRSILLCLAKMGRVLEGSETAPPQYAASSRPPY